MHITRSELVGFRRFRRTALNEAIEHLRFSPTQPYQLILGTNGCGKSTFMRRLTPWPADKNEFTEDGYESFEFTHRGSHYRLSTEYRKKQSYTFIKDDVKLNDGGTVSIQRQLITEHLGLDEELNDLILGRIKFTSLKPLERRVWLTRLSEADYGYAIALYKKLASRLRDTQGSLRRAKSRLVTETEKALSEEDVQRLEEDLQRLEADFNHWSSLRNAQFPLDGRYNDKRQQGLELLGRLSQRLLRTNFQIPCNGLYNSPEAIQSRINVVTELAGKKAGELSVYVDQYTETSKLVQRLEAVAAEGVETLQAKLVPLQERRTIAFMAQRLGLILPEPALAKSTLATIRESLEGILLELPRNSDRRYSNRRLEQLRVERLHHQSAVENERGYLARAVASKNHADTHRARGNTVCPKCNHVWVEGYSDAQYEANEERIAGLEAKIAGINQLVKETEDEMDAIANYAKLYRELNRITETWTVLDPFWELMVADNQLFDAPSACAKMIPRLAHDIEHAIIAQSCDAQIRVLNEQIASALAVGDADLQEALDEQATLEAQVETITSELSALRTELDQCQTFLSLSKTWEAAGAEIASMIEQLEANTLDELESSYQRIVSETLTGMMRGLVVKRDAVQAAQIQRALLVSIAEQIEAETLDEAALAELVKELSPTEGLIAEGQFGFIKNFTGQMNHLIQRIWTYPLQVLPCGGADEFGTELNYKFPMMVSTKDNIVPDVSLGSSGQREIIDLAHQVVAMRYSKLADWPLFLDEFASSFDEAHRAAAMSALKALMEQYSFTQMFMISHYEGNHGTLTNAEVLVLCDLNISVPAVYNTHVDIL